MRPSNKLDAWHLRRIRTIILSRLKETGRIAMFREAYDSSRSEEPVRLQEVSLFTGGGNSRPAAWMLKQPKCEPEGLVMAYEAFADQALGLVTYPGRIAEKTLSDEAAGDMRRRFNLGREPRAWARTAVRLVALAQFFPDAVVNVDLEDRTFTALLSGATLQVTPTSVYCNYKQAETKAPFEAIDIDAAAFVLPEVVTTERTICAVYNLLTGDTDALNALRGLYECLEQGLVTKVELRMLFQEVDPRTIRRPRRRRLETEAMRETALEGALAALNSPPEALLRNLYDATVPLIYSSQEFLRAYGSPKASPAGRKFRQSTLEKWAANITAQAAKLG